MRAASSSLSKRHSAGSSPPCVMALKSWFRFHLTSSMAGFGEASLRRPNRLLRSTRIVEEVDSRIDGEDASDVGAGRAWRVRSRRDRGGKPKVEELPGLLPTACLAEGEHPEILALIAIVFDDTVRRAGRAPLRAAGVPARERRIEHPEQVARCVDRDIGVE